jgi:hypothetical protein
LRTRLTWFMESLSSTVVNAGSGSASSMVACQFVLLVCSSFYLFPVAATISHRFAKGQL